MYPSSNRQSGSAASSVHGGSSVSGALASRGKRWLVAAVLVGAVIVLLSRRAPTPGNEVHSGTKQEPPSADEGMHLKNGFTELQRRVLWKELQARPDLAAALVSSWDVIRPTPHVPKSMKDLQQFLVECIDQVDPLSIPDVDRLTGCSCSCENFVPWRRFSSYAKLAYCVGKLPDVLHYMDAFISYGGTAIPVAQGMLDAGKAGSVAVGWEILPSIVTAFAKVRSVLPNMQLISEYTLTPGSVKVDGSARKLISAEGSMVDYCRQNHIDVALVDGGYGTLYMMNGQELRMGETWIALDVCKPKYLLQVSINMHAATSLIRDVVLTRGSYAEVMSGYSRGVACGDNQLVPREFALYVRTDAE